MVGGARAGPSSSSREVNASLIWVDGKRMIHLKEKGRGGMRANTLHSCEHDQSATWL